MLAGNPEPQVASLEVVKIISHRVFNLLLGKKHSLAGTSVIQLKFRAGACFYFVAVVILIARDDESAYIVNVSRRHCPQNRRWRRPFPREVQIVDKLDVFSGIGRW